MPCFKVHFLFCVVKHDVSRYHTVRFANMLTLSLLFLWQNIAPPAPPLKAQTSPLANMFTQENNAASVTPTTNNSTGSMAF